MSLIAGIFSGACNAALLAVINMGLKNTHTSRNVIWAFVGLCLLLPLTRYTAEILLSRLGQGALFRLRMQLCRQMLAAPLYHLEEIGPARLLTALTDDVPTITNAIGSKRGRLSAYVLYTLSQLIYHPRNNAGIT